MNMRDEDTLMSVCWEHLELLVCIYLGSQNLMVVMLSARAMTTQVRALKEEVVILV